MSQKQSGNLSAAVWKENIFEGKVVFCTGGNGSICSVQLRALVHLGANACLVGRNVEKTESVANDIAAVRPGSKVLGIGGIDVRDTKSLSAAVETCVRELGGIDFLIAGAAGNFLAPISQLSFSAFKAVIDIDVLGSYSVTKLALPHLIASAKRHAKTNSAPGGRIIYVSATIHFTGLPMQSHVSAAKAGVDALSNSVAIEYGPYGITSNVICPGAIAGTEGMSRLSKKMDTSEVMVDRVPLGRLGNSSDIADATVFLFSEAASYITGSSIVVDGGAWRTHALQPGEDFAYPGFLLSGDTVEGVGGQKRAKM
ncbi:putative peroxisomal 2,4-dienoyl-CoA reductase SPS19 [Paraphoma chrysanthemicola]|nr:putative peroxisomal 2,4-dienoyl-CoA reductase SPS19 [Paraphoma chrysanthemicola]